LTDYLLFEIWRFHYERILLEDTFSLQTKIIQLFFRSVSSPVVKLMLKHLSKNSIETSVCQVISISRNEFFFDD